VGILEGVRPAQIKMLCYDSRGFWLITRRFSQGRLPLVAH
jgi:hypothetical protein